MSKLEAVFPCIDSLAHLHGLVTPGPQRLLVQFVNYDDVYYELLTS